MAQYDLTRTISKYLDRHLVLPLLEFLEARADSESPCGVVFDKLDLTRCKYELTKKTRMIDYAADLHKVLNPDSEADNFKEQREAVVDELRKMSQEVDEIMRVFQEPVIAGMLSHQKDARTIMDALVKDHGFKPSQVQVLYRFAKFQYDTANYPVAAEYLSLVRALLPSGDPQSVSALWGLVASEILQQNWDASLTQLKLLKQSIDDRAKTAMHVELLEQRTWFVHWSLFVLFNIANGKELIIEWYLKDSAYLNVIQTACPHLLRYLTVSVIICNPDSPSVRRQLQYDITRAIQQEASAYRDPVTEFVECLTVRYDFDQAQTKLQDCHDVLMADFFLVGCVEDFMENARLLMFETFCRIHHCISLAMVAEKLGLDRVEAAEKWIVNLIRRKGLDAKIDSKAGNVVMGVRSQSIYDAVIEKTKNLSFKSQILMATIEKRLREQVQRAAAAAETQPAANGDYPFGM